MSNKLHPDIIDVEASGIGLDSYPIEVGAVLSCGTRYCSLVKPLNDWTHWSDNAEKLHGISRDVLMARGKGVKQVCTELNQFIGSKTIFSDNAAADKPWLRKLYITAGLQPTFQIYDIERLMVGPQKEFWMNARSFVSKQFSLSRHRASNEAFLIQQTFIESHRMAKESRTAKESQGNTD